MESTMDLTIEELQGRIDALQAAGLFLAARALERELSYRLKKGA